MRTDRVIRIGEIIRHREQKAYAESMAMRLVGLAAYLPGKDDFVGWQMDVPIEGAANAFVFGTDAVTESDLTWVVDRFARQGEGQVRGEPFLQPDWKVYELAVLLDGEPKPSIGFEAPLPKPAEEDDAGLPRQFLLRYPELMDTLRATGAVLRYAAGPAGKDERQVCADAAARLAVGQMSLEDLRCYIGQPVRARMFIALPEEPSIRLRSILGDSLPGVSLRLLGCLQDPEIRLAWENPTADAEVLPARAAAIIALEPMAGSEPIMGLSLCDEPARSIPASHRYPEGCHGVSIGHALGTDGFDRPILIPEEDLRRHVQVVGQTGTGKSTVLTQMAVSAIEGGFGLTLIDPHGSTVDAILRRVSRKDAKRVRVVRIGDLEHPVPMGIWSSDDPSKEERTISDIADMFQAMQDPHNQGYVGPRFRRIWGQLSRAAIGIFGRHASFASVTAIAQDRGRIADACRLLQDKDPELVRSLKCEIGENRSNDFGDTLSWWLSKFADVTGSEQLRRTFGAGENALGFGKAIDTDAVTLVSLDSPVLGASQARMAGTLVLMDLWKAAMSRQKRDRTHLVLIDEAQLFQTSPVPQMLCEARKFGLSLTLCTQHMGALSAEIRDALDANSASFIAFRQSAADVKDTALKLDDPDLVRPLRRLDALSAIASVSIAGVQSSAFTLVVDRPEEQAEADGIVRLIEERSWELCGDACSRALTSAEIGKILDGTPLTQVLDDIRLKAAFERNADESCGSQPLSEDLLICDETPEGVKVVGITKELPRVKIPGAIAGKPVTAVSMRQAPLLSLDLGECRGLGVVYCTDGPLEEIILPEDNRIRELYVHGTRVKDLDLNGCGYLEILDCSKTPVEKLDLKGLPFLKSLHCSQTQLEESLDLSGNQMLESLFCHDSHLHGLDVSHNPLLENLTCNGNELGDLDVSGLVHLRKLRCSNTRISSLSVEENPDLEWLDFSDNFISRIDLSKNPKLVMLNCEYNELRNLSIDANKMLKELFTEGNPWRKEPTLPAGLKGDQVGVAA